MLHVYVVIDQAEDTTVTNAYEEPMANNNDPFDLPLSSRAVSRRVVRCHGTRFALLSIELRFPNFSERRSLRGFRDTISVFVELADAERSFAKRQKETRKRFAGSMNFSRAIS